LAYKIGMFTRLRNRRVLLVLVTCIVVVGVVGWVYRGRIIGSVAQLHLGRVAAEEERSGHLTRRRETIELIHRRLLLRPPPDVLVPELYDLVTLMSARLASGEISLAWAAYLYTSYLRDALSERPTGLPRSTEEEIAAYIQREVEFFYLKKRPEFPGASESFTLEEVEAAYDRGRDLSRD
jgi:hypothetical protein